MPDSDPAKDPHVNAVYTLEPLEFGNYGAVLNPSIALGISVANLFTDETKDALSWFWLFGGVPFGGSLVALFFYEFVYKRTQEMLQADG